MKKTIEQIAGLVWWINANTELDMSFQVTNTQWTWSEWEHPNDMEVNNIGWIQGRLESSYEFDAKDTKLVLLHNKLAKIKGESTLQKAG